MNQRTQQLQRSADDQIGTLIALLSTTDDGVLHQPCAGRDKLGDGTVGAFASHTAENYQRIAAFIATGASTSNSHASEREHRHRMPGLLRRLHHAPPGGGHAGRDAGHQTNRFAAGNAAPEEILERLQTARTELARVAQLTDRQLDAVPPRDSFRFCDGERTLEQVLAALLKHQGHQVQALQTALAQ